MIGSIVLLVVLIFLNAVFASAEIAVLSMNEAKLKRMVEQKNKKALKLSALTQQPARFLATIQVAITLAGFLSSAFAADNFAEPLVGVILDTGAAVPENVLRSAAVFIITLILAYFNLVFGELVPKRIAMKKADAMALKMAGLLHAVSRVFAPLVALLTWSTNMVLKLLGIDPNEADEKLTEEEIRMMLAEGNQQGIIDEHENEIIQNLFEFDGISAEQICTHRLDVAALDEEDTVEEWEKTMYEKKHAFYPLYRETKDNITGILDAGDYFRLKEKKKEAVFREAVRSVYFIPEEMKADTLFQNMRRSRQYFAVLLDEYGGMSGIITIRDLIEAIVGDIYEGDAGTAPEKIRKLEDGTWIVSGEAELGDVARALGVELQADSCGTFNGLVYSITDSIPEDGTAFTCEACGLRIRVTNVKNHRVVEAAVEVLPQQQEG